MCECLITGRSHEQKAGSSQTFIKESHNVDAFKHLPDDQNITDRCRHGNYTIPVVWRRGLSVRCFEGEVSYPCFKMSAAGDLKPLEF